MLRRSLFVVSLVMVAGSVFAQNLLVNPGFDVGDQLTGWTCESNYGLASWSAHDRLGVAGSGSVELNVMSPEINRFVACSQCVPVSELETYFASGWHFWPDDPDVSQDGSFRLSFIFYGGIDCTSSLGVSELTIVQFPPLALDTWHHLVSDAVTAPAGSMSALINVVAWQDLANEPVRARIDDLHFSTTILFQDGFETGDFTGWSASVP